MMKLCPVLIVKYVVSDRFGQPIKVNWAYASGQREDTTGTPFWPFAVMAADLVTINFHFYLLCCVLSTRAL